MRPGTGVGGGTAGVLAGVEPHGGSPPGTARCVFLFLSLSPPPPRLPSHCPCVYSLLVVFLLPPPPQGVEAALGKPRFHHRHLRVSRDGRRECVFLTPAAGSCGGFGGGFLAVEHTCAPQAAAGGQQQPQQRRRRLPPPSTPPPAPSTPPAGDLARPCKKICSFLPEASCSNRGGTIAHKQNLECNCLTATDFKPILLPANARTCFLVYKANATQRKHATARKKRTTNNMSMLPKLRDGAVCPCRCLSLHQRPVETFPTSRLAGYRPSPASSVRRQPTRPSTHGPPL